MSPWIIIGWFLISFLVGFVPVAALCTLFIWFLERKWKREASKQREATKAIRGEA